MSDFGHYGGSEEEYATVRKHDAEVVRRDMLPQRRLRKHPSPVQYTQSLTPKL